MKIKPKLKAGQIIEIKNSKTRFVQWICINIDNTGLEPEYELKRPRIDTYIYIEFSKFDSMVKAKKVNLKPVIAPKTAKDVKKRKYTFDY